MEVYKVESQELWYKLKEALAGIAFFRFDPVDGYYIKMSNASYQQINKQGIILKQVNYE